MPFARGNQLAKLADRTRSRFITEWIIAVLNENPGGRSRTNLALFAETLVHRAIEGDMVAAKEVLDGVEGRVPLRHSSGYGTPVEMITRIERVIVAVGQVPEEVRQPGVIEGEAEEIVDLPGVPNP